MSAYIVTKKKNSLYKGTTRKNSMLVSHSVVYLCYNQCNQRHQRILAE